MLIIPSPQQVNNHGITFAEAFIVWSKIALLSFGGHASQISLMHRLLLVEEKSG